MIILRKLPSTFLQNYLKISSLFREQNPYHQKDQDRPLPHFCRKIVKTKHENQHFFQYFTYMTKKHEK